MKIFGPEDCRRVDTYAFKKSVVLFGAAASISKGRGQTEISKGMLICHKLPHNDLQKPIVLSPRIIATQPAEMKGV